MTFTSSIQSNKSSVDKTNTIFAELIPEDGEQFKEKRINPEGAGLEYDTLISACEIDQELVFWTISDSYRPRPYETGESKSFGEAEQTVLKILNGKRALLVSPDYALQEYLEQRIEKTDTESASFTDAARLEFVHEKYGQGKYQIQKKTPSKVIVYATQHSDKFTPAPDSPTFTLNKRELDNKGETKARGQIFCTEQRKMALFKYRKVPRYLKVFNLDWSADVSDVKYWFRKLSMEHHPDRGGDPEEFREIIKSYEKAVKAIQERERLGYI